MIKRYWLLFCIFTHLFISCSQKQGVEEQKLSFGESTPAIAVDATISVPTTIPTVERTRDVIEQGEMEVIKTPVTELTLTSVEPQGLLFLNTDKGLSSYDLASGKLSVLLENNDETTILAVGASEDGSEVAYLTQKGADIQLWFTQLPVWNPVNLVSVPIFYPSSETLRFAPGIFWLNQRYFLVETTYYEGEYEYNDHGVTKILYEYTAYSNGIWIIDGQTGAIVYENKDDRASFSTACKVSEPLSFAETTLHCTIKQWEKREEDRGRPFPDWEYNGEMVVFNHDDQLKILVGEQPYLDYMDMDEDSYIHLPLSISRGGNYLFYHFPQRYDPPTLLVREGRVEQPDFIDDPLKIIETEKALYIHFSQNDEDEEVWCPRLKHCFALIRYEYATKEWHKIPIPASLQGISVLPWDTLWDPSGEIVIVRENDYKADMALLHLFDVQHGGVTTIHLNNALYIENLLAWFK